MPTHSLQSCVESPDGPTHIFSICSNASTPGPGSSMTPHTTYSENAVMQAGGSVPSSCMFCDQTFTHQDELGPHVLSQHPTTFSEPTVLRVEAEFRIPGERPRSKPSSLPVEKEEVHSCIVCGHVSQDASELETHTRKHKDYFTYCCNVCGRRFREPWFLKNHMKKHVKPGAKSKAQQDPDTPVTINGIVQDPNPETVVTLYKMCMVCGFFFPDHETLVEHSKVHNREVEPGKVKEKESMGGTNESPATQETFLHGLKLLTQSTGKSVQQERSSKWIPQLDPFVTYQAWQLATKGKIAVGPNTTKDTGQEASTDNESGSDKEELNNICSEGQGDKVAKEGLGRELRSQQHTVVENPEPQRRSLMQKDKDKERPTTCEECHRTFRTYHQLVLHSRVHKRERGGGESPPTVDGKLARAGEQPEEGCEEGLEEAALSENLGLGEEGTDRSKVKPKECTYCGKSFRSSYYLTVHLRTHTGEKPFKCAYCDYAAAQKTSLKYHLERRHKDKPLVDIASRPVPSVPSPMSGTSETTEERLDGVGNNLDKPVVQMNVNNEALTVTSYSPTEDIVKCPVPANLKTEEVTDESFGVPLNLSLKVSVSLPASAEPRDASILLSCSFCSYRTMYPEVLIIHKRLTHKDKTDTTKKTGPVGSLSRKRRTGCPPTLNGKDVDLPPMFHLRYPRRTKSPPPQPAKPQEKMAINQTHGLKQSTIQGPLHGTVQETQRHRQNTNAHPSQEPSKYPELMRKSNTGSKYVVDPRPGPPDRAGISERSYPMRSGVIWHSDAARMCLSSQFGSLPQIDFGEPTSKRLKFTVPSGRQADTGEKPGFRGPTGDGTSRVVIQGRSVKTTSQGSAPSTVPDNMGHLKTTPTGIGALDNDWGMMNFLRSYTTNELASLYHSTPANPGHGGLANLNAGGRTVLYQHLPTLPTLQMRDPSGFFPTQRYGSTDKST